MRRPTIALAAALIGVLALAVMSHAQPPAGSAYAQSTLAEYTIDWFTIDAGGAMDSSGGEYTLSGTIGQPDTSALESGTVGLNGGFWAGAEARYTVALPLAAK